MSPQTKAALGTHHGRYSGPPGDETVYLMPRDRVAWEKAWDAHQRAKGLDVPAAEALPADRKSSSSEQAPVDPERSRRQAEALAFVASYTGTFGLILDIRANPRFGTKYMRLSDRQVEVILAARDRDAARAETRAIEQELLADDLYQQARQEATDATDHPRSAPTEAPRLAPQPAPGAPVHDGWYTVDGGIWKVQWNRERTRLYAKRLDGTDWVYVPGGLPLVAARGVPLTLAEAEAYGKLYGICAVCGATLTNEQSIERGIGPICAGRL